MNLVIDANIIFASLIKEGLSAELLFSLDLNLYSPEFVLEEIEKHRKEILEKTKRSKDEFEEIIQIINLIIKIIPKEDFKDHIEAAKKISHDIDDVQYLALALRLECPIWSNDKDFKKQDKVKIFSTNELLKNLKVK